MPCARILTWTEELLVEVMLKAIVTLQQKGKTGEGVGWRAGGWLPCTKKNTCVNIPRSQFLAISVY